DELGMSPSEFARKLRLKRAHDLLVETAQPISEVALETGFADGSHFSRRFRDAYGKSPSQVRRHARRREQSNAGNKPSFS
ncbi:MAG TPA: helix-turn-helix domain-containing protein, partial [Burkholderiales bacterium]|nr:helix-turn-helix domain-containing protein [Burkholderiales bacterium]